MLKIYLVCYLLENKLMSYSDELGINVMDYLLPSSDSISPSVGRQICSSPPVFPLIKDLISDN